MQTCKAEIRERKKAYTDQPINQKAWNLCNWTSFLGSWRCFAFQFIRKGFSVQTSLRGGFSFPFYLNLCISTQIFMSFCSSLCQSSSLVVNASEKVELVMGACILLVPFWPQNSLGLHGQVLDSSIPAERSKSFNGSFHLILERSQNTSGRRLPSIKLLLEDQRTFSAFRVTTRLLQPPSPWIIPQI